MASEYLLIIGGRGPSQGSVALAPSGCPCLSETFYAVLYPGVARYLNTVRHGARHGGPSCLARHQGLRPVEHGLQALAQACTRRGVAQPTEFVVFGVTKLGADR